ncbi:SGNH/GDSL hydrolase family protein [Demequina pelophila]|uniref:SGNH/GDSL hydrolase family protein n=1 Tax=Demequina pelophila TaxID=1638984 RepID=UPI00138E128A|nr:SGNH/GDSL hydrolase family protein [Demequina pelophila]
MNRAALLSTLGLALAACAAGGGGGGDAPTTDAASIRLAVVGDSLSAGFSRDFSAGDIDGSSWVPYALGGGGGGDGDGDGVSFAGGTAVPGATAPQQLARAEPVDADVLVLALGTNDLAWRLPFEETAGALVDIAATVGAPRVMLLAIPPIEPEISPTTPVYNRQLRRLAADRGWEFVDAPAPVRDGDAWAPGATTDGVHYTLESARLVGATVGDAIRAGA